MAAVIFNGKIQYAVFGDTGPTDIIGEASYACAQKLGINPDPKNGGVGSGVTYISGTRSDGVFSSCGHGPRRHGITSDEFSHERGGEKEAQFHFGGEALLPVRHEGRLSIVRWGCGRGESRITFPRSSRRK